MNKYKQLSVSPHTYMQEINSFILETSELAGKQITYARYIDSILPEGQTATEWPDILNGFTANVQAVSDAVMAFKDNYRSNYCTPLSTIMNSTVEPYTQIEVNNIAIDPQTGVYLAQLAIDTPAPVFAPITAQTPLSLNIR
jgi:hypothetical protein